MNTFLTICLIVLPLSLLMGFAAYLARQSAKGMPVKRTLSLNITAFVVWSCCWPPALPSP